MSRNRIAAIVAVLVLLAALVYFFSGGHETPAGQPKLAEVKPQNFATLADAFNAAKQHVRVLVLLSPT
jgi:hypothetical protein